MYFALFSSLNIQLNKFIKINAGKSSGPLIFPPAGGHGPLWRRAPPGWRNLFLNSLSIGFVICIGRNRHFITKDPAGFVDGSNHYTYVKNNSWTYFDPADCSFARIRQPCRHSNKPTLKQRISLRLTMRGFQTMTGRIVATGNTVANRSA